MPWRNAAAVQLQRQWRQLASRRHASSMMRLREASVCVVCHDECTRVVRCINGHPSCVGCVLGSGVHGHTSCAICREPRAMHVDRTLAPLLEASSAKMRCGTCRCMVPWDRCEDHRAWCPEHAFACPYEGCHMHVRARDLAEHVHRAHRAPVLLPRSGTHTVVMAMRPGQDNALMIVSDTVVAAHLALPPIGTSEPLYVLALRAHYASAQSPPLVARVRQYRMDSDEWISEHRVGTVPPVLASREMSPAAASVPLVHACLADAQEHATICASMAWPAAKPLLWQVGVRDVRRQTAFRPLRGTAVVIVELLFEESLDDAIGEGAW